MKLVLSYITRSLLVGIFLTAALGCQSSTGVAPPGDPGQGAAQGSAPQIDADKIAAAMAELSEADRELAMAQEKCPVSDALLGKMGPPKKVHVGDRDVFICCDGCESLLKENSEKYLAKLPSGEKKQ